MSVVDVVALFLGLAMLALLTWVLLKPEQF
jgi:hypothetical protein